MIRNKRIFITGGTGFVGKSLMTHCPQLKENDIVVLSRHPEKRIKELPLFGSNKRLHFIRGDVRNFEFPNGDFDYILHGATTSGKIIPENEMISVVVDGTRRILDFAMKNRNLTNLLYISSGGVYGDDYGVPINEDFACKPVTIYGKSKLEAESLCKDSCIPFSIARCFAFVGEYLPLDKHFAIGNFIRDCLYDLPIVIKGDGTPLRTYLFSADLAQWLWTLMISGVHGRAYNVGSAYEVSIKRLAEIVRNLAGSHNPIKILSSPSGNPPHRYVPDVSRVKEELYLETEFTLEEAIRRTMDHHERRIRAGSQERKRNV